MMDLWMIQNIAPLFYLVMELSIAAVCIGLGVLLLRKIADKRIPPIWKNALWLLVLVALVVPYRPSSNVAVIPTTQVNFRQQENILHTEITQEKTELTGNYQVPVELTAQREDLHAKSLIFQVVIPAIWLMGIAVMMGILLATRQKMRKNLRTPNGRPYDVLLSDCKHQLGITKTVEIVEQSYLKTPALYGLLSPKILLPDYVSEMSEDSQKYILLHELSHLKHWDLWKNTLLLTLQIVYWFNPLVWLLFRFMRQDMELLNDQRVLKTLEKSEETPYAMSLIQVLGHSKKLPLAPQMLCMVDNKGNTKRRIQMIQLGEVFKKHKIIIAVGCLAVIGVLSALFLTAQPEKTDKLEAPPVPIPVSDSFGDTLIPELLAEIQGQDFIARADFTANSCNYTLHISTQTQGDSLHGMAEVFDDNALGAEASGDNFYYSTMVKVLKERDGGAATADVGVLTSEGKEVYYLAVHTYDSTDMETLNRLISDACNQVAEIKTESAEATSEIAIAQPETPPTSNEPKPLLDLANDPNVTIVDYVPMDDMAYGKVGIVCYIEGEGDTVWISYLTQDYEAKAGIGSDGSASPLPNSKLTYLGNAMCEIDLFSHTTGEEVTFTMEYWPNDGDVPGTNFKVTSSDYAPDSYTAEFEVPEEIVGDPRLLTADELAYFNDNYFDILYDQEDYYVRFSEGTRMGDTVTLTFRGYEPDTGDMYEMIAEILTLEQVGDGYVFVSRDYAA